MSQTDERKDFESRVKARLSEDGGRLDARTLSRLNQARQAALSELGKPARPGMFRWLPVSGALAAAVMVALLLRQGPVQQEIPGMAPVEDIEIILSEQELELYEDLEFYAWLELQPELG